MSLVVSVANKDAIVIGADRMSCCMANTKPESKRAFSQRMYNVRKLCLYSENIAVGFVGAGGAVLINDFTVGEMTYDALEMIPWQIFFEAFKEAYPDLNVYSIPSAFMSYCKDNGLTSPGNQSEMLVVGFDEHANRFRATVDLYISEIKCASGFIPMTIGVTEIADAMIKEIGNDRMKLMSITDAVDLVEMCIKSTAQLRKFKADLCVGDDTDVYVLSRTSGCGWAHYHDVSLLPYCRDEKPEPPKVARKVSQASKKVAKKTTTKKTR